MPLRRDGDRWWSVVLFLAVVVLLAAAVAGLALHTVTTSWRWTVLLTSFAHQAMSLAPVALLLAVVGRRWVSAGVAALVTALVIVVQVPPALSDDPPAGGHRIVVLQANLRLGNAEPAPLVDRVRDGGVELLATEELTNSLQTRLLAAGLGRLLPYHYLRPLPTGGSGLGIWSKYPLSGTEDLPGFWLGTLRARVATPAGALTFYAVHLTPPYPFDSALWLAEMPRLRERLRAEPPGPVLAAGDYNATVDHAQFRDLLGDGYADAAQQAGEGYLPSYPTDRWFGPVIAIDHVLTRGAVATSARTLDQPGSDHRALLTTVSVG